MRIKILLEHVLWKCPVYYMYDSIRNAFMGELDILLF